ncbi:hypothetical protein [Nocardioides salsibiostraticola]
MPDENHLDDLFDRFDQDRALTGGDWLQLSTGIAHAGTVYLPPAVWNTLCTRLVNELTRSSGIALVRRHEAIVQLLQQRRAPRHVMRALGRFVLHPHAQSVVPALTLLREVRGTESADLVMRLIMGRDNLLRRGASIAAGGLAAQGSFTGDSLVLLEKYVAHELHTPSVIARRLDVFDIATQLPEDAFERLLDVGDARTRRQLIRVRMTGELASPAIARPVADRMAEAAETALGRHAQDPDLMLRRLLREALFHVQRERRHLAATVISVSPYGPPIAKAALALTGQGDELTARTSWSILRRLGHLITREEIGDTLRASPHSSCETAGMITMGLARGPMNQQIARHLRVEATDSPRQDTRHAALFALGMSGDENLETLIHGSCELSARATWWKQTGPALLDSDVASTHR